METNMMRANMLFVLLVALVGCEDPGPGQSGDDQSGQTTPVGGGTPPAGAEGGTCTASELFPLGFCTYRSCTLELTADPVDQQALLGCVLGNCAAEIAGLSAECQGCLLKAGGSLAGGGLGGDDQSTASALFGCVGNQQ